ADGAVPVAEGQPAAVGPEIDVEDGIARHLERLLRRRRTYLPDPAGAVVGDYGDEPAIAAQIGPRWLAPARQEDYLLIAGHFADATVALLVGPSVDLKVFIEIDRQRPIGEALPLLGKVQIGQRQSADGLVAQLLA